MAPVGLICFQHTGADGCVHALADELEEQLNRSHVLLGHSMGALLAYSRSQQRISRGLRLPEAVIAGSCRAPRQQAPAENRQSTDDYQLAAQLARYGGHFLSRSPDPALVTAIARVAAAATFHGSGIR